MRLLKSHPLISLAKYPLGYSSQPRFYKYFSTGRILKNEDSDVSSIKSNESDISEKIERTLDSKLDSYETINETGENIKAPLQEVNQMTDKLSNLLPSSLKKDYDNAVVNSEEGKQAFEAKTFNHTREQDKVVSRNIEKIEGYPEASSYYSEEDYEQYRMQGEGNLNEKKSIFAVWKAKYISKYLINPELKRDLLEKTEKLDSERSTLTSELAKVKRLERIEDDLYYKKKNMQTPTEYVAELQQTQPLDIAPLDD